MATPAASIKTKIKAILDDLVTGGTLGSVVLKDINSNVLDDDMPGYPCAILGTSSMQSDWEYQAQNKRTYIFNILIVQLQDNLSTSGDMEGIRDGVALAFDNNVTLTGFAPLGVAAVFSDHVTYASKGKNFVLFNVTIKATTLVAVTYNF